jgi:hypothetical protein
MDCPECPKDLKRPPTDAQRPGRTLKALLRQLADGRVEIPRCARDDDLRRRYLSGTEPRKVRVPTFLCAAPLKLLSSNHSIPIRQRRRGICLRFGLLFPIFTFLRSPPARKNNPGQTFLLSVSGTQAKRHIN